MQNGAIAFFPKCLLVALLAAGAVVSTARAETSLDEIETKLSKASAELDRVDQLLSDPDRNRRSAAMQMLISSDNPAYVRRAKEIGLFSSDPELQETALKAILDAGGPFRIILDLSRGDEEQSRAKDWSTSYGNVSSDGTTGAYPFRTDAFDAKQKCWRFQDDRRCALFLTGTTVSIEWPSGTGSLLLGTDGVLSGSFYVRNAKIAVPARIPLMD